MQKKLEVIDTIKVLMMLAVVLYHCCMFFTGTWFEAISPAYEARYISALARYLNTFHVPAFTMASGYLFYCLRTEQGKYQCNCIEDVKKREKRLLLPYLSTLVVWVIPYDLYFNGMRPLSINLFWDILLHNFGFCQCCSGFLFCFILHLKGFR